MSRVVPVSAEPPLPPPQAWTQLEKAEHEREVALREELIRQEKLELLAQRFDHKAAMRQTWLGENQRLVSQVGTAGLARTPGLLPSPRKAAGAARVPGTPDPAPRPP